MSKHRDFLTRTGLLAGFGREAFSHLESFGRLMAGKESLMKVVRCPDEVSYARMTTTELRAGFLVENLFTPRPARSGPHRSSTLTSRLGSCTMAMNREAFNPNHQEPPT